MLAPPLFTKLFVLDRHDSWRDFGTWNAILERGTLLEEEGKMRLFLTSPKTNNDEKKHHYGLNLEELVSGQDDGAFLKTPPENGLVLSFTPRDFSYSPSQNQVIEINTRSCSVALSFKCVTEADLFMRRLDGCEEAGAEEDSLSLSSPSPLDSPSPKYCRKLARDIADGSLPFFTSTEGANALSAVLPVPENGNAAPILRATGLFLSVATGVAPEQPSWHVELLGTVAAQFPSALLSGLTLWVRRQNFWGFVCAQAEHTDEAGALLKSVATLFHFGNFELVSGAFQPEVLRALFRLAGARVGDCKDALGIQKALPPREALELLDLVRSFRLATALPELLALPHFDPQITGIAAEGIARAAEKLAAYITSVGLSFRPHMRKLVQLCTQADADLQMCQQADALLGAFGEYVSLFSAIGATLRKYPRPPQVDNKALLTLFDFLDGDDETGFLWCVQDVVAERRLPEALFSKIVLHFLTILERSSQFLAYALPLERRHFLETLVQLLGADLGASVEARMAKGSATDMLAAELGPAGGSDDKRETDGTIISSVLRLLSGPLRGEHTREHILKFLSALSLQNSDAFSRALVACAQRPDGSYKRILEQIVAAATLPYPLSERRGDPSSTVQLHALRLLSQVISLPSAAATIVHGDLAPELRRALETAYQRGGIFRTVSSNILRRCRICNPSDLAGSAPCAPRGDGRDDRGDHASGLGSHSAQHLLEALSPPRAKKAPGA